MNQTEMITSNSHKSAKVKKKIHFYDEQYIGIFSQKKRNKKYAWVLKEY